MILAFGDGEAQASLVEARTRRGGNRHRLVAQHHASEQRADLLIAHRVLGGHVIDLGHLPLARAVGMDELAVVGQQQQAGGVLVEPADGLHAAQQQRPWQQRENARVKLRPVRAFVTRRLVQRQIDALAIAPAFAIDSENALRRVGDLVVRVVATLAAERDAAGEHPRATLAPAAETLQLQQTIKLHEKNSLPLLPVGGAQRQTRRPQAAAKRGTPASHRSRAGAGKPPVPRSRRLRRRP